MAGVFGRLACGARNSSALDSDKLRQQCGLAYMENDSWKLPPHIAWANALAICERLEFAERNQLKSYAALLIARHVLGKVRRRSLSAPGSPMDGGIASHRGAADSASRP